MPEVVVIRAGQIAGWSHLTRKEGRVNIVEVTSYIELYNRCAGKTIVDVGWEDDGTEYTIGIHLSDGTELEIDGTELTVLATE